MLEHMRFQKAGDAIQAEVLTDAAVNGKRHIKPLGLIVDLVKHR
jgi:hypothetical protein